MNLTQLMKGKSGFVTAAGSGIGRASAITLSKAGAKVMVSDVNEEAGHETVRMIKDTGGIVEFYYCDVTDETQVKAMVNELLKSSVN